MKEITEIVTVLMVLVLATQVTNADFVFGTPENLGSTVNSSAHDGTPTMPADGLSLFFDSDQSGGNGAFDVWVTTRASIDDEWGKPVNLGSPVNTSSWEGVPSISADGLTLYISSDRAGGSGQQDIWISTRETIDGPWSAPVNLGPTVNSASLEWSQSISADGLELYFSSGRPGGSGDLDLWVTTRPTTSDEWTTPVNLGSSVNTSAGEVSPSISTDGLCLFFFSDKPGGYGSRDVWVTTRATRDDQWRTPMNLGAPVNTSAMDQGAMFSADGSTIFFCSSRSGGYGGLDLLQISIEPIADLSGDGFVDILDLRAIVDHWGQDYPLCDIGPTPFGDGIVNVQDLIVLSEYLFTTVDDPTLVAQWALDETEGMTAHDNVNGNDDFVMGGARWQPAGGVIDGALELDGVDDCLIATVGPDTAAGPFSVVAWIQGGGPGQAIFSRPVYGDWLMMNAEGKLMTELKSSDGLAGPLLSETVITDGQWHRIGLVWDGSRRKICVDGVTVAEDMQDGLEASAGGLYVGVGKNYTPGTFFSGLIDDVRIYNRAVSP